MQQRKYREKRPTYQQQPQFAPDPSTPAGQQQLQARYQNQRPNRPSNQMSYRLQGLVGALQGIIGGIGQYPNQEQIDSAQVEGLVLQLLQQYGPELINQPRYPPPRQQFRQPMQQPFYQRPPPPQGFQPERYRAPQPQLPQQQDQETAEEQAARQQRIEGWIKQVNEVKTEEEQKQQPIKQVVNPVPVPQPFQMPYPPQFGMMMPPRSPIQRTICFKHFPEPYIMQNDIMQQGNLLCKKCIPELLQQIKGTPKHQLNQYQTQQVAYSLGLNAASINAYSSEKNLISRGLDRISNVTRDYRYFEQELKDREKEADEYLQVLPNLMSNMFDQLGQLLEEQERQFQRDITDVVRKQQITIDRDKKEKVPNFNQKLSNKYTQLQQAIMLATNSRNEDEQIRVYQQYIQIFTDLDAEFDKYFNEFESIGKLQRLLDEDPNEIINDYTDLVERNLRLDYNVKSSFIPQATQRLHSFQWNQRYIQIYKVKSNSFEKRLVSMEYEVPLYSRSIAIEDGSLYLIGGYIKNMNKYLNACYRYDELFGTLIRQAPTQYYRADHSLCAIEGFIYVVGTFIDNKIYGLCERYDTQKNKWKVITPMKIPRTGVALCSYKNQYLFAFGGRIDQKHIVDVIEAYDIKRNVWQEVPTSLVDKSKWVPAYMSIAYQITEKEIMIFGGKSSITGQIFNGVFIFDIEKMSIFERGCLVNPSSFMNLPLVFNHTLYAYGNDSYIHKYSIPEQKWSCTLKTIS